MNISKLVISAAITALSISGASAADMAVKALPPAPAPVWSWTGFYIGADVGGVWTRDDVRPVVPDGGTFPRSNRLSPSSAFGGGTAGFNWQTGQFVFGIEGDLGYMDIRRTSPDLLGGTETDTIGGSGLYGDITGRAGIAFGPTLLYGKGGYAFYNGRVQTNTGVPGFTVNSAGNFDGWTAGGGIEYKFAPAWSVKAEYLHFDFGTKTATLTSGGGVFPYSNSLKMDTVKVGINYTFNWAPQVTARY